MHAGMRMGLGRNSFAFITSSMVTGSFCALSAFPGCGHCAKVHCRTLGQSLALNKSKRAV